MSSLEEKGQAHAVTDQSAGDDTRAEIVTRLGGPLHKRLFLCEPTPLAGQQPPEDRLGVPRQPAAHPCQLLVRVREHGPFREAQQSLLGNEQPISHGQFVG